MFRKITGAIRDLADALNGSRQALIDVLTHQLPEATADELGALRQRLDELERSRALWEAEVEGLLQKVEGERRQARSAEERARALLAKADPVDSSEPGPEDLPEEYMELLRERDEAAGGDLEVPAVRPAVAGGKSAALNRKFGIGA